MIEGCHKVNEPYRIIDMPIEPIEGRYSEQWTSWFREMYRERDMSFVSIEGDRTALKDPSPGEFLNPATTFRWKHQQLSLALDYIMKNSAPPRRWVVFLHDAWFPGIEMFAYLKWMVGINIRICGFWHAGAYDHTDLLALRYCNHWAHGSEITWFRLCDYVFVGTEYHRAKILAALGQESQDAEKVIVTGEPVEFPADITGMCDRKLVVWPHRIATDKRPEMFEALKKEPSLKHLTFVRTKDFNFSKRDYYKLLKRAKIAVSTATHENFGISMIEACLAGCYPVVPDDLAYRETIPSEFRYKTYDEMVHLIRTLDQEPRFGKPYVYPWAHLFGRRAVIDVILSYIDRLGRASWIMKGVMGDEMLTQVTQTEAMAINKILGK